MEKNFILKASIINDIKSEDVGQLIGEDISFPTTGEEIQHIFEQIEINAMYPYYSVIQFQSTIPHISEMLGKSAYWSIDELNFLSVRLNELPENEFNKFKEILESGFELSQFSAIKDYINLTYNLDKSNYNSYPHNEWDIKFDGKLDSIPNEYRAVGAGKDENIEKLNYYAKVSDGADGDVLIEWYHYLEQDSELRDMDFNEQLQSFLNLKTTENKGISFAEDCAKQEQKESELPEDWNMSEEELKQIDEEMMLELQEAEMSQDMGLVR